MQFKIKLSKKVRKLINLKFFNKNIFILEPECKEKSPLADCQVVESLFQCKICGFIMNSLLEKVIHQLDCEKLIKTENVQFTNEKKDESHRCIICNIGYNNISKFISHLKNKHNNVRNFKCELCSKAFKIKCHLKDHISRRHNDIKKVQCQQCTKEFIYESHLKIHLRRYHNKERTLICIFCEKGN